MVADTVPRRVLLDANGNDVAFTGAGFSASNDVNQNGNLTVGTSEVAIPITGSSAVLLRSDPDNTGRIYIGKTGVANDGSAHLLYLDPGDDAPAFFYDNSTNPLYAIATIAGQTLSVGALI